MVGSLEVPPRALNGEPGVRQATSGASGQPSSGLYQFLLVLTNSSWFQAEAVNLSLAASPEWAQFARELGMNLRRARDAKGLTQEQMAERASISLYAYQQYERGASTRGGAPTNPRLATVLTICQALEISVSDLLPEAPRLAITTS